MKAHQIPTKNRPNKKRKGRGIGSGLGKTAGRGTKGQNARSGGKRRPGFEGGQTSLVRRIPKNRGFNSLGRTVQNVTTGQLDKLKAKDITNADLKDAGLIKSAHVKVKVIMTGDINSAKKVSLQAASKGAITAIEKAGGSFTSVDVPASAVQSKE